MNHLSWEKRIPFFKNTYLLRSVFLAYLVVIGIVSIIIVSIFVFSGDADKLAEIVLPFLGIYFFIFMLILVSTWIAVGNKYAVKYTINHEGIRIEGTKDKSKDIRKLAITAGILATNPGLLGSGLLLRENIIEILYKDIQELEWKSEKKLLVVKTSFWNQVAIHYPKNNESELKAIIEKHL